MKRHFKKALSLFTALVVSLSTTVVFAENDTSLPYLRKLEWGINDGGHWYKYWDGNEEIQTHASSSLPIVEGENLNGAYGDYRTHLGSIYDFGQYDLEEHNEENNKKGESYSNGDPSYERDTLVTAKYSTEEYGGNLIYPLFYMTGKLPQYETTEWKLMNYTDYFQSYSDADIENVKLTDVQKKAINNILKLGYGEIKNKVRNSGTGTHMMSNIDSFLATQWNLFDTLKDDLNLTYTGDKTEFKHAGEDIRLSKIRETDGDRTSVYLEAAVGNLDKIKNDDLDIKLVPQSELELKDGKYSQTFKLSIPLEKDMEIWNIKEQTKGEHKLETPVELSLDKDIEKATIEIKPVTYAGEWETAENFDQPEEISKTTTISADQGDIVRISFPESSVKSSNTNNFNLIAKDKSDNYEFEVKNIKYPLEEVNDNDDESLKEFKYKNKEGFKYLYLTGTVKSDAEDKALFKFGSGGNGGGSVEDELKVTYDANTKDFKGEVPEDSNKYKEDDKVTVLDSGDLSREGYTFKGWNTKADGSGTSYKSEDTFSIKEDTTLYAQWEKDILDKVNHNAYLVGYPDGTVQSDGNITRAETSAIYFRLLTDEARKDYWKTDNKYTDVTKEAWYNNEVSTLSNAGVIKGYPTGDFKPDGAITRAEFASITSRFLGDSVKATNGKLNDIEGHWAKEDINKLVAAGIIEGYGEGIFKPEQSITRAEAAKIVNGILERTPHKDGLLKDMKVWPDNNEKAWYYLDIQEATNTHEYERDTNKDPEKWTKILPNKDWTEYEKK